MFCFRVFYWLIEQLHFPRSGPLSLFCHSCKQLTAFNKVRKPIHPASQSLKDTSWALQRDEQLARRFPSIHVQVTFCPSSHVGVAFSNVWRGPLSCSLVAVDTTKIPLLRGSPKILQTKRTNTTLEEAIVTIGNNDRKFACIYIYTAFIIIALWSAIH